MVDESNPVISRFTSKIKELINNKADKTNATQSDAGLMSAEDKIKLDEMSIQIIDEGTEINNDGIYLIYTPVFMKAVVKFTDLSQDSVQINFPTDDTTNLIIDWGDGTQDIGTPHTGYNHVYDDNTKTYNVIVKGNIKSVQSEICKGPFSEIELEQDITAPELLASGGSIFTKIILPTNLSTIPFGFCEGQRQIQNIIIPDGVTTLDGACFQDCTSLSSITIPDSVTTISYACFQGCTSLSSITISNNVITLGNGCFANCTSLSSIAIPDSVTTLGRNCVNGDTHLSLVELYWTSIPSAVKNSLQDLIVNSNMTVMIPPGTTELYSPLISNAQLVEREE